MPRLPSDPRYYLNLSSRTSSSFFTEDNDTHSSLSISTPTAPEQRIETHALRGFFRGCIAAQSSSFNLIKHTASRFYTSVTALRTPPLSIGQQQCRLLLQKLIQEFNNLVAVETAYTGWKAEVIGVAEMGTIIPSTLHIASIRNMLRNTLQRNDVHFISRIQEALSLLLEWGTGSLGGELTPEYPPKLAVDELIQNIHEWTDQRTATLLYDRNEFLPWISHVFDRTASNATLSQILLGGTLNLYETAAVLRWVLYNQDDERTKQHWKATLASGIGFERAQELLQIRLDSFPPVICKGGNKESTEESISHGVPSSNNPYHALDNHALTSTLLRPLRAQPSNLRNVYDSTDISKNRTLSPLAERIFRKPRTTIDPENKSITIPLAPIQSIGEITDSSIVSPKMEKSLSTQRRAEGEDNLLLSPRYESLFLEGGQSPTVVHDESSFQPKITTEEDYRNLENSVSSRSLPLRFHFMEASPSLSSTHSSHGPVSESANTVHRQLSVGLGHTESTPDSLRTRVLARLNSFNYSPSLHDRTDIVRRNNRNDDYTVSGSTPFPFPTHHSLKLTLHATVSEPLPFLSINDTNEDDKRMNGNISPVEEKRYYSTTEKNDYLSVPPPLGQWRGKYREEMNNAGVTTVAPPSVTLTSRIPLISRQDTEFQGSNSNIHNPPLSHTAGVLSEPGISNPSLDTVPLLPSLTSPVAENMPTDRSHNYPLSSTVATTENGSDTLFSACGWCVPWFSKRSFTSASSGTKASLSVPLPQITGGKGTLDEPYVMKGVPVNDTSHQPLLNPIDIANTIPTTKTTTSMNSASTVTMNHSPVNIAAAVETNELSSDNVTHSETIMENTLPFRTVPLYAQPVSMDTFPPLEDVQSIQNKHESLLQRLRNRRSKYNPPVMNKDSEDDKTNLSATVRTVSSDVLAVRGRQRKRKE